MAPTTPVSHFRSRCVARQMCLMNYLCVSELLVRRCGGDPTCNLRSVSQARVTLLSSEDIAWEEAKTTEFDHLALDFTSASASLFTKTTR